MSQSATPVTRNEATTRLKPPKMTTSAKLPIGTTIRSSYERLRNGCGRLRTVADGCDRERNVERTHPQPPDPQSETGTLGTHSGKRLQDAVFGRKRRDPSPLPITTWRLGGGYKYIRDILGTYGTYYLDTALTVCQLVDLLGQHLAHLHKGLTALT